MSRKRTDFLLTNRQRGQINISEGFRASCKLLVIVSRFRQTQEDEA